MTCSNCKTELPDGAMFCTNCGTKCEAEVPAVETPVVEETVVEEPVVETPAAEESVVEAPVAEEPAVETPVVEAPVQETPATEAPVQEAAKEAKKEEKEKKKAPIGLIIGIGAAVVVLLVLILGGVLIASLFKSNDKQLAYLKDETIYYVKNMEKEKSEPIPVCEVKGESAYASNTVAISDNGKYIYYYSKVDYDYENYSYVGTLNRNKISKLSDDVDDNEDSAEKISNDVTQYTLLDDGKSVLFRKSNGKVILYNGKDEEDIAKNVDYYYVTEDEEKVILYTEEEDTNGLKVYNLKTEEELEYTDDFYSVYFRNDEYMVFGEMDEEGKITVYRANYKEDDCEELVSDVYSVAGYNDETKSFYYREERIVKRNLYDYIDDPYASEDAGLSKPNYKDFCTVSNWEEALSEYDFEYYCVKYPQYQSNFFDWELYYDYANEAYYYYKYEDDENGNSVKVISYYEVDTETWYRLDSEAYEAAKDAYEGAEDRIVLREELKNTEFEIENYDLYFWKNGEETLVAEGVDEYLYVNSDIILYTTSETAGNRVSIDNVYSTYDAESQIRYGSYYYDESEEDEEAEATTYNYVVKGNIGSFEVEDVIDDANISDDGKSLVLSMGTNSTECVLDLYEVSGSEIKFVDTIEEDAMDGTWEEGTYYYYTDVSDSLATLYSYKKGKSEKVASNVVATGYQNAIFSDGNLMLMDDYDNNDYYLLLKNGEKVKFKGIDSYSYIEEKKILYLKNDSLYFYNGKDDDIRIARDVVNYYYNGYEYGNRF